MDYCSSEDSMRKSVIQDGMCIEWDVPVPMRDGIILRADVYRPVGSGKYPALLFHGPYGKNLHFKDGYTANWNILKAKYPEIFRGTSGKYMNWETADPEKWVPHGYAIVRIDSRGAARSPGFLDLRGPDEIQDYYECIEFFAQQPWCNGNIGLSGISYYAISQWAVAALNPPHLKAICPFEGCFDTYRDNTRHGGIFHDFRSVWYPLQVKSVQHGQGKNGRTSSMNGVLVSGPETLPESVLEQNRIDATTLPTEHEMLDDSYLRTTPDITQVRVPVLSCANWGGNGLHLRGNIEGYKRCSSKQKWLEIHGREHFCEYYTDYGVSLQKRFFDYFLKGEGNWEQPPVSMQIKHTDGSFTAQTAAAWPIPDTKWTKYYLQFQDGGFGTQQPESGSATFQAEMGSLSFFTEPLEEAVQITGPAAAKLFLSSTTEDADLYLIFRVLDPEGRDVTTVAANVQEGNLGTGWLRASHRKLDPEKSTFYQPWHTHDEKQPLVPGEIYELDVEIWPLCMTVPAGYRFGFTISGRDFPLPYDGNSDPEHPRGHAIYTHRVQYQYDTERVYSGDITLYAQGNKACYITMPII